MKKFINLICPFLVLGPHLFAQGQTVGATANASLWDDPRLAFYGIAGLVFLTAMLVVLVAIYILKIINLLAHEAAKEKAQKLGIELKPEPSLWEKIWQRSNALLPVEQEQDIMLDHNYDGIRELDNHLPPWWTGLFYVTIVFAVVYLLFFHVLDILPSSIEEYNSEVADAREQVLKLKAASPSTTIDETNVEATTDSHALMDGKQTFLNTCASCHRKDGGGDIGPNLTDGYWLHGGSIREVFKVIRHGAQGTNMIAWEGFISPEKMRNVASYVLTLKDSNPSNPKKPQGEIYKPEKKELKKDTVKSQAKL